MHRLVPLLLTALLVASCSPQPAASPTEEASAAAATEAPPATDPPAAAPTEPVAEIGCDPVEKVPIQGQGHLVGDQKPPVPYNSTPPTSGWHASGEVAIEIAPDDTPLTEPQQVTVLEMGGIVVSFRQLPDTELSDLSDFLTERFTDQVALTRYRKLDPGQVALTGWGVLQHCTGVDKKAIAAFVEEHVKR